MTNEETLLKIQVLKDTALLMCWAYHDAKTNEFLFLPEADHGSAAFNSARAGAVKRGAIMIGAVALMAYKGLDGEALIEDEALPGVNDEIVRQAKRAFRDYLIGAGILETETAHS